MSRTKVTLIALIACVSLSICLLAVYTSVHTSIAASRVLTVPDDYPTIQSAINNASTGDTVFVKNGLYSENVVVDKSVTLKGENNEKTIISGPPGGRYGPTEAISVTANDVTITGFNIIDTIIGISVGNVNNTRIIGNNIAENYDLGISVSGRNTLVSDNNITANQNTGGIEFYDAINCILTNNVITKNHNLGVSIQSSTNITVSGNHISFNERDWGTDDSGGISLYLDSDININNNNIDHNNGCGIVFAGYTNGSKISKNTISNNEIGVKVSNYQIFHYSIGQESIVWENDFLNNTNQAVVQQGLSFQPQTSDYENGTDIVSWDKDGRGNYWSDYQTVYPNSTEIGNTGIGNTPYVIAENSADHYPLTKPVDSSFPYYLLVILLIATSVTILTIVIIRKKRTGNLQFNP